MVHLIQYIRKAAVKEPLGAKILVASRPLLPSFRSCYLFWKVQYLTSSTEAAEAVEAEAGQQQQLGCF